MEKHTLLGESAMEHKKKKQPYAVQDEEPDFISQMAGVSKDDPHFEIYMEEVRKYRKRIDQLAKPSAKKK